MSRREKTERQILLALEEQIRETGMGGVGINAIAKRAGVSKELIYRYFDGMPGLMLAWMREQDFWTRNPGLLLSDEASQRTPADLVLSMLRAQVEALAGNDTLREVRRWELIERNEVSAPLAERRERAARDFIDRIDGLSPGLDAPAVVSVMLAGVLPDAARQDRKPFPGPAIARAGRLAADRRGAGTPGVGRLPGAAAQCFAGRAGGGTQAVRRARRRTLIRHRRAPKAARPPPRHVGSQASRSRASSQSANTCTLRDGKRRCG